MSDLGYPKLSRDLSFALILCVIFAAGLYGASVGFARVERAYEMARV